MLVLPPSAGCSSFPGFAWVSGIGGVKQRGRFTALTGLFPITHISIFSSGRPGLVFCIYVRGYFWTNLKEMVSKDRALLQFVSESRF